MRITSFELEPFTELPFLNAGKGRGSPHVIDQLPVHLGRLSSLPESLDALIATADLQGREAFSEPTNEPPRLLGEAVAEHLACELLPLLNLRPERVGILLAGDFYTVPKLDKRGGSGDVSSVWLAFAQRFKWVAGVAGNHDKFGDCAAPSQSLANNSHYLDGNAVELDGLSIAGIGGIVGNPDKSHRKTEDDFARLLKSLAPRRPAITLMHDGPDDPPRGQQGSPAIRQTIETLESTLLIRGHCHWQEPLAQLTNETQVLNLDCRVAVLQR